MLAAVAFVELLYWDGCPSHPQALAELRAALEDVGRPDVQVTVTEIVTEDDALERGFIGSPTVLVGGVDVVAADELEPTRLTCRVYRRRDGRYAPTPDPLDLRDALRRLLPAAAEEARA
jgi:hypothetical protein